MSKSQLLSLMTLRSSCWHNNRSLQSYTLKNSLAYHRRKKRKKKYKNPQYLSTDFRYLSLVLFVFGKESKSIWQIYSLKRKQEVEIKGEFRSQIVYEAKYKINTWKSLVTKKSPKNKKLKGSGVELDENVWNSSWNEFNESFFIWWSKKSWKVRSKWTAASTTLKMFWEKNIPLVWPSIISPSIEEDYEERRVLIQSSWVILNIQPFLHPLSISIQWVKSFDLLCRKQQ